MYVCMYIYICVCVLERERNKERRTFAPAYEHTGLSLHECICVLISVCVYVYKFEFIRFLTLFRPAFLCSHTGRCRNIDHAGDVMFILTLSLPPHPPPSTLLLDSPNFLSDAYLVSLFPLGCRINI